MRGEFFDEDGERARPAAEALRAYAERVYLAEQIFFRFVEFGIGIARAYLAKERVL